MGARSILERAGGLAAVLARLERVGRRDTWLALVFHHISDGGRFPVEDPRVAGLGVDTPVEQFDRMIGYLASRYDVVPLTEAVAGGPVRHGAKRRLLLCFDDAYASVADVAAPMLARRGLPWVFFVNTGLVGSTRLAFDNQLAYVANVLGPAALRSVCGECSPREVIGRILPQRPLVERQAMSARLQQLIDSSTSHNPAAGFYVSREQLLALHGSGVEIGHHTRDHVHCRALAADEIAVQIASSAAELRTLTGGAVRSFAYPYGFSSDATPAVRSALVTSGHETAFLVEGRLNGRRAHDHTFFRVNLTSSTPGDIAWQTCVLPRLRVVTQRRRVRFSSSVDHA